MKAIDYESPTHKLKDVLFKVKLQPLYTQFQFQGTEQPVNVHAPHLLALVNQDNGRIISVVSKNYKIITNEEALEMGKDIFVQLYPQVKKEELLPYKIVAPGSLASAHIDLIHKDVNFEVWEQEKWLPFLRVTNSYNRTFALSFEMGFVRKLCSNGVVFNKRTMKLKYVHDNSNRIKLKDDVGKVFAASDHFKEQCNQLRKFEIPEERMFPLLCHILRINLNVPERKQALKKLNYLGRLLAKVNELTEHYKITLGMNAYTTFNVATDLVSHNDDYNVFPGYYLHVRSFFARPTDWMEEFINKANQNEVYLDELLNPTISKLENLKIETGFSWN